MRKAQFGQGDRWAPDIGIRDRLVGQPRQIARVIPGEEGLARLGDRRKHIGPVETMSPAI
jgi:hypothetical protein